MRNLARIFAVVSVLVVVSACGSSSDDDASSGSSGPTTSDGSSDAAGSEVVAVRLQRSGGLKPVDVDRLFSADDPPPDGYDQSDLDQVIAAAEAFTTAGAALVPVTGDTCCDRYVYKITIEYADGTSKTYETIDGLNQPKVFDRLVLAVS